LRRITCVYWFTIVFLYF